MYKVILRLSQGHRQCDRLIVSLFSDDLILRITNQLVPLSYEQRRQVLEAINYVNEIIEVIQENLSKG